MLAATLRSSKRSVTNDSALLATLLCSLSSAMMRLTTLASRWEVGRVGTEIAQSGGIGLGLSSTDSLSTTTAP